MNVPGAPTQSGEPTAAVRHPGPPEAGATEHLATKPTRLDRRRERTRRALLDAARAIMAEHGTSDVSIQEITERADVGFGSFYNHFSSKTELFEAAVGEVLEEHGQLLDEVTSGIEDPAAVFALAVRATARLAVERPAVAQVLVRAGLDYLVAADGLAPRALRDVERAVAAGRFIAPTPFLAVVSTTGCLMAYLHVRLNTPHLLERETGDELAESLLRMLGMEAAEAHEIAHRPFPSTLDGR
jgi:AcrR family transcriptional regulator